MSERAGGKHSADLEYDKEITALRVIARSLQTAEIAELKKNWMKIPSAFLRELSGEISSFIFPSSWPLFRPAAALVGQRPTKKTDKRRDKK
jgi:hypothetical protein